MVQLAYASAALPLGEVRARGGPGISRAEKDEAPGPVFRRGGEF